MAARRARERLQQQLQEYRADNGEMDGVLTRICYVPSMVQVP